MRGLNNQTAENRRWKTHYNMRAVLKNLFLLAVGLQLLSACSLFTTTVPDTETTALQSQQATSAMRDLQGLPNIDTLIKLDNHWLSNHFETEL